MMAPAKPKQFAERPRLGHDAGGSMERREYLKQYLLACVRDSAISWSDLLTSPDKFLRVLSRDVKVVLKDLGREGGAGLLRVGVTLLAGVVEKIATSARK